MSRLLPSFRIHTWFRALLAGLVVGSAVFEAEAGVLEVGKRMTLLVRVLSYDRQLAVRGTRGMVVLGVAFAPHDSSSVKEKDAVLAAIGANKLLEIQGLTLAVVEVPYTGPSSLKAALGNRRAAALYVCEGLDGAIDELQGLAAAAKFATISGSEAFTRQGLAVAAFDEGSKGRVMVNLEAAREQGLDLEAAVLNLAVVLRSSSPGKAATAQKARDIAAPALASTDGPIFQTIATALKRRTSGSAPEYPNRARVQGWEATLNAKIFISAAGAVEKIEFIDTDRRFEDTVRQAVAVWRFTPYLVGGKPVGTYTKMTFSFKLQ